MGTKARILLSILTLLLFDLAMSDPDATSRPVRAGAMVEAKLEVSIRV